jgi:predicted PurR-regulated permease PerM
MVAFVMSAEPIRERLDRARCRLELAGLEADDDLARELAGLALLVRAQQRRDGAEVLAVADQLDRTVSSSRAGMYESSARPTRMCTTRPSGSVASSSTGFALRVTDQSLQEEGVSKHGIPRSMDPILDRIVHFRPRTIFAVLGILILVGVALYVIWVARHVLSWVLVALFLTLALNPAVEWLQRHGVPRRGLASGVVYLVALVAIGGLAGLFIPTIVDQVNSFANKVPDYVNDLTKGRGRLGFLETRYHVVEKVKEAVNGGGVGRFAVGAGAALSVTKSVLTAIVATLTIVFMTLFMLLEGPMWVDRIESAFPEEQQHRVRRVLHEVYRTVGGYVSGNLLISLIAGISSGVVLWIAGVPYAVALGLLVALLDLIPLAGATIAAIIVVLVAIASAGTTAAIIVGVFFVIYQQVENHLIQPLVYGRTVQLSPLAVLVSVLIGAQIAGVLGALAAIPVAGTIQVLLLEWRRGKIERVSTRTIETG